MTKEERKMRKIFREVLKFVCSQDKLLSKLEKNKRVKIFAENLLIKQGII